MNYFITKSNFLNITRKVVMTEDNLMSEVYSRSIYFLNDVERKSILCVKQFLEFSSNKCYEFVGNGFFPDSYSYVNEKDRYACFHTHSSCLGLNSSYNDFAIPIEIKFKHGSNEIDCERVKAFRVWFKQEDIQDLFKTNLKRFIERLQLKFNLLNPPKEVDFKNDGFQEIVNMTQEEIEGKINYHIAKASIMYRSSTKAHDILVKKGFSKMTFLVSSKNYRTEALQRNNTGYTDCEVRQILDLFYNEVKKPIMDLLIAYWIVKLNPTLNFSENILTQLEFKACNFCKDDIA